MWNVFRVGALRPLLSERCHFGKGKAKVEAKQRGMNWREMRSLSGCLNAWGLWPMSPLLLGSVVRYLLVTCLLGTARWLGRRNRSLPTSNWRELYHPLIENSHRPPGRRRGVRVPDCSWRRASSPRPVWPTRGQSLAQTAARKHPTSWLEVNPGKLVGWWWTWGCCQEVCECSSVPCKRLLSLVVCCPPLGTCPNPSGLGDPCKR